MEGRPAGAACPHVLGRLLPSLPHPTPPLSSCPFAPPRPPPPPASRLCVACADQRSTAPAAKTASQLHPHQGAGGTGGDGHGIVVVGASVVPLTAAQREELGAFGVAASNAGSPWWLCPVPALPLSVALCFPDYRLPVCLLP